MAEYVVTVKKDANWKELHDELSRDTSADSSVDSNIVPDREVITVKEKPDNKRNTHYELSTEEAEKLKADNRILKVENVADISFCAATHNAKSSKLVTELMLSRNIPNDHKHICFSQLFGMSDNLSFNLSYHKYNVSKYVPYGPIKDVIPYLIRRAKENSAISGQMSRELKLIHLEHERRKVLK